MSNNYHFYQPKDGHPLKHDPFNAIIAPRPIGWISTVNQDGSANLAPYSFFNAFNYTPPIIGFSSIGYKDSARNAQRSGEFCWNLVSATLAEEMNQTSAMVDGDEFELAGLQKRKSTIISPPHVAKSPVVMECKTTQVIQLKTADNSLCETFLVLGEVVAVHIEKSAIVDGVYQTAFNQPIMRGGGVGDYFSVDEAQKFEMLRPK
ncbi:MULTISPECIES: flavin reductase family protein [Alteromonadaceae]|uniref:flavin reductase family protein n=1 Tax=Alteromonadaceae TaxID=72275 RepID=UPI001C08A73F|nr:MULTISPECIES: flavin reductase family protein [Aliiglaciecola]MBU2877139.1 flavin reductase family protein [Aliiglaciecola lipolytica]MDO6712069.1 flavin reductase family protein [Aliiglaciecola sp. 2_MG-2023]MDO6753149.1 flavin reductase family protein [Aliiglaciecola sp. 1_MG-2023]